MITMQQTVDNNICETNTVAVGFSWKRVEAIARFFYPMLRKQMVIYPIVSLVLYSLALGAAYLKWTDVLWTAPVSVIAFMFYLSPLVLTRRDSRMTVTMLPATALEKSLVLIGYFLVVIPLLTYGVYYIVGLLCEWLLPVEPVIGRLLSMRQDYGGFQIIYQVSEAVPVVTCLWVVMIVKRNPAFKAVGYTLLSMFGLGIIGMIYGLIMAFTSGFVDSVKDVVEASTENMSPEQVQEVAKPFVDEMMPLISVMGVLSVIYVLFVVYMIYRTIKTRQD